MKYLFLFFALFVTHFLATAQSPQPAVTDSSRSTLLDTVKPLAPDRIHLDSSRQLRDSMKSELKAVTVIAKKPLMVQEIDKTVINVESMISSSTSNLLEVLAKTPGVSVGVNGEISLNGKNGVLVLIDGKPTYLSETDLANYLKTLPGGSVDKLELMDNPSARYDAQGGAVINIRLKRNRSNGFTGNVATGFTTSGYTRNNNAVNLNYHSKAVTLYANLGNNNEANLMTNDQQRSFYDNAGNTISAIALNTRQITRFSGLQGTIGIDLALDSNTTVGASINGANLSRRGDRSYSSEKNGSHVSGDSSAVGYNHSHEDRHSFGATLNFSRRMPKNSGELSAEVNLVNYSGTSRQMLRTDYYDDRQDRLGNSSYYYDLPSTLKIFVAKADYTQPLGAKGTFEAGIKSSAIENHDIGNYFTVYPDQKVQNADQSNDFLYNERITAAYATATQSKGRFTLKAGLRAEHTHSAGLQSAGGNARFSRNYSDYFPGIYLNYKLDSAGNNTLNLSYSRRLSRPNYQFLNPFRFMMDPYLFSEGNPSLTPQYQNRVELKFQHKQLLTMGLSYNAFDHVILPTSRTEGNVLIQKPSNIAVGFMALLNTTVSAAPTRWWNFVYTLRLSRIGLNGTANDHPLRVRASVARLEINNSLMFAHGWSGEIGGYYASRDLNATAVTLGMYRVQAAVQKKLLHDKMSIRLVAEDIFHTWIYHNKSVSLIDAAYTERVAFDSQRFGVALTYRFGRVNEKKRRTSAGNASDEEKGRVD